MTDIHDRVGAGDGVGDAEGLCDSGDMRDLNLVAYRLYQGADVPIVPAPLNRSWMKATRNQFANRCLPLLIANQAGWFILNTHAFRATWNGGDDIKDVTIEYPSECSPPHVISHFGSGILTWNVPYLFRTPPGYNLLVRGPSNWPKDGVYALEGLVESDWADATFTVNWKLTRPNLTVNFEVGEPICMIVPQRRGELEDFSPVVLNIATNAEVERGHKIWAESRQEFLNEHPPGNESADAPWQKHYFHGKSPSGSQFEGHQYNLKLRKFEEPDAT